MLANIIRNAKKTVTGGDPYYSAVSLLLPMDGTNGSTTFTDSGPNAIAVTASGNAQISTTQSKYGGASGYYDGSTGYLSLTGNSSFQFGTGDFTVEAWVYISANAANQQTFLDTRGTATATPCTFGIYQSKLAFYDGTMRQSSATITTGQWYHCAACRSGGTLRLFIDGISYYSASSSTNFTTGANSIYIGRGFDAAAYYTNGYIDDLRVTKYARYTSAFAPPAQAHLEYANGNDRHFSNVSLLLHMDGADGSTTFTDNSSNSYSITKYGTAAISTTQSQSGGASAYFDGSGARLGLSSTAIDFGTGDFTAECWLYIISTPTGAYAQVMGKQVGGVSASWLLYLNTSRILLFGWNNTAQLIQSPSALNLSQWYHVAVARSGSTIRMFIDGTQVASTAISYTFASSTEFTVGSSSNDFSSARLNAYIDDIRLTKVARYTSNFTPPTSAHPNA